jgi:hypothetical protein
MQAYRVVKVTVKTGCDLCREVVKSNLSQAKAHGMRDKLESANEKADFDPNAMVSYLVEPVSSHQAVASA